MDELLIATCVMLCVMFVHSGHERYGLLSVADLKGAEPAPSPLSSALFGRLTDTVTVLLIIENGTVLWQVLNFDRSTVKHALQNTQNDCHQWLSRSFRVHHIRFWSGGLQRPQTS